MVDTMENYKSINRYSNGFCGKFLKPTITNQYIYDPTVLDRAAAVIIDRYHRTYCCEGRSFVLIFGVSSNVCADIWRYINDGLSDGSEANHFLGIVFTQLCNGKIN